MHTIISIQVLEWHTIQVLEWILWYAYILKLDLFTTRKKSPLVVPLRLATYYFKNSSTVRTYICVFLG